MLQSKVVREVSKEEKKKKEKKMRKERQRGERAMSDWVLAFLEKKTTTATNRQSRNMRYTEHRVDGKTTDKQTKTLKQKK